VIIHCNKSLSRFFLLITLLLGAMLASIRVAQSQEQELVGTPLAPSASYTLTDKSELIQRRGAAPTAVPSFDETADRQQSGAMLLPEWGDAHNSVLFNVTCTPDHPILGQEVTCTITLQNLTGNPLRLHLVNAIPYPLELIPGSVSGAEVHKNRVLMFSGLLAPGLPAEFAIIDSPSPAGYVSLAGLGTPPLADVADDTLFNFATDPFLYLGQTYTVLGATSNGYVVPGGGSETDLGQPPQTFPDSTPPNNVVAPFWTDLDPSAGGNMYAAAVFGSDNSWVVIEWENVPAFDSDDLYTFQVWLASNSDTEDVSLVYQRVDGSGAAGGLSVGAEDETGSTGANFPGVPTPESELKALILPPTPGEAYIISYQAIARYVGPWHNCALIKIPQLWQFGLSCASGQTVNP
jgi:hypothetical protein